MLQKLAPVNPMLRAMERPSSAASQEPQGHARIERLPAFGCRLPVVSHGGGELGRFTNRYARSGEIEAGIAAGSGAGARGEA